MRLLIILFCSVALLLLGSDSPAHGAAPKVLCSEAPCQYRMQGGNFYLRLFPFKIACRAASGVGSMNSTATGMTTISFSGCRERVTPFAFGCVNAGGPLGTIETNELSTTSYEEGSSRGLQFGGLYLSFVCGGLEQALHIEGFFTGDIDPQSCDETARRFPMRVELIGHGREGSDPNYDVYVDGYGGEQYEFTPRWPLAFEHSVKFVC
jgi:hypothetical protein